MGICDEKAVAAMCRTERAAAVCQRGGTADGILTTAARL